MTSFAGTEQGRWKIDRQQAVTGEGLPPAARLEMTEGAVPTRAEWVLRGVPSYDRYVHAAEQAKLRARSPELGRPEATRAALIPIRKSAEWWELAQDERREILEERSAHIATGLKYLPAVARRLHHSRDLGEPFDFLTWFEYAPRDADAFEELVAMLRETLEWRYVEREVDLRLSRNM